MHVQGLMASDPEWLTRLVEDYKIIVNTDENLVSLKYNQIESPMHEPIVQECRGMVVCAERRKVLAHPYNKFWNHGDVLAAPIDWASANVLEKLDGSLMTLYWDAWKGAWMVASSGTPRASGSFGDREDETFRDAFWRIWHSLGMREPDKRYRGNACFMFELCDQPNRIVVKHDKPRIVMHGGRFLDTGTEMRLDQCVGFGEANNWEVVKSYPIASIADCLAAADTLDPIACEGFIVVDAAFNRVKIKSPRYVILHHMKGEATPRRAIDLWRTGETSELLLHFPEFAPKILPVHERLEWLAADCAHSVQQIGHLDRKGFAQQVVNEPWRAVAFKLYGGQASAADAQAIMRAQTTQALERMLEASQ
jgi:hypothetical protein